MVPARHKAFHLKQCKHFVPGGQLQHAWLLFFILLTNQITREKEVKCQQQTGFLVKVKKQVENPRNPYNKRADQTRPGQATMKLKAEKIVTLQRQNLDGTHLVRSKSASFIFKCKSQWAEIPLCSTCPCKSELSFHKALEL
jgi:hypothetical protein